MEKEFPRGAEGSEKLELIAENNQLMDTQMLEHLNGESVGGNAGSTPIDGLRYPCAAARCWVDRNSGKIIVFGNIQDLPEKVRGADSEELIFKVALDTRNRDPETNRGFFKIVDTYYTERLSETAREVIAGSVERWNLDREL
jgi:hypothetical protein